jgi:hypothetical protein
MAENNKDSHKLELMPLSDGGHFKGIFKKTSVVGRLVGTIEYAL